MTIKEQAIVRSKFYTAIEDMVKSTMEYESEPFKGGLLVSLGDGNYVKINVAVANPDKFSVEDVRREYAEILAARAERAEKARLKAEERARKERDKAEKAAEKASE